MSVKQRINSPRYAGSYSGGFTLLEVMVALVVMSVGLLSLAGMQVIGLRTNHSAYMRTQATILSYDIVDRMRANIGVPGGYGVQGGDYDQPTVSGSAGVEHTACEAPTGSCQMAEHDLFKWNQAIADILPNGQGIVCIDDTPEDGVPNLPVCSGTGSANPDMAMYTIKIWWSDDQSGNFQRFSTSFRP